RPVLKVLEITDRPDEAERFWIALFLQRGAALTNVCEGGTGRFMDRTYHPGERNGNSKFTEAQARYVLASPLRTTELARKLGVPVSRIQAIRYGSTWRHLRPVGQ